VVNDNSESQYIGEFSYKIINDPIYGCISLSETEVKLLDTRAMQRLRRVRQMGFASYVFPSGEHSRFVHSLGVLCIVGKMCDHLYRKYNKKDDDGICFTLEDARLVRIAALLHDVGHFPFSHLSECVYSYIDNVKNTDAMVDGLDSTLSDDFHLLSIIANYKKRKEKDHEHLGAEVISRDPEISEILKKADISPEEVGRIIYGDGEAKPVHAQLLHSSLDADRLDYLLRDSRQAGVSFGNVELDYILRQMKIVPYLLRSVNGTEERLELIVFDYKSQHAIEHFLMGRYFHYTQVVLHKTSMVFEAVAKALLYKVLSSKSDSPYSSYDKIVRCIGTEDFYMFTDDYSWQLINDVASKTTDDFVKLLWDYLSKRKKPVHVLTMTDIMQKNAAQPKSKPVNDSTYFLARWLIENTQETLACDSGIDSRMIGYVESKVSLESIPSHLRSEDCTMDRFSDDVRGAIRIVDKDGQISFLASDSKSLINKMVDYTSNTLDIFVIGDIAEESIVSLRKTIQQKAKQ